MRAKITWYGLAVLMLVAALVVACVAPANTTGIVIPSSRAVYRWHDPDFAVTCWMLSGGISCLPDAAFE